MNQLDVSLQHSIATLTAKGWSARKVARELGVDRETVSRYLRLETAKPAIPPIGSPEPADSKPAILPIGPKVGRTVRGGSWGRISTFDIYLSFRLLHQLLQAL
jgi:hypothetical protein